MAHLIGFFFLLVPFIGYSDMSLTPKWVLAGVAAAAGLCWCTYKGPRFTLPDYRQVVLLIGGAIAFLITLLSSNTTHYEAELFKVMVILGFVFIGSNTAENLGKNLRTIGMYNGASLVLCAGMFFVGLTSSTLDIALRGGFSNSNIFAEFLGFSLLLQFYNIKNFYKDDAYKLAWSLVPFFTVVIIATRCRSVMLGLAWAAILWLSHQKQLKHRIKYILGIFIVIAAAATYDTHRKLDDPKYQNANVRLIRWQNTLSMIKDHPMGVGIGQFEFAYLPYARANGVDTEVTETNVVRSPHNSYLALVAEYGIPFGVLFLLFIGITLYNLKNSNTSKRLRQFYSYFFMLTLVTAFFSFPMETPFAACIIAFMFGQTLACTTLEHTRGDEFRAHLMVAASILLIFTGIVYNYGLRMWVYNIKEAGQVAKDGNSYEAKAMLDRELRAAPNNFLAMRAMANLYFIKRDKVNGCKYVKMHNKYFIEPSAMKDIEEYFCKGVEDAIK